MIPCNTGSVTCNATCEYITKQKTRKNEKFMLDIA